MEYRISDLEEGFFDLLDHRQFRFASKSPEDGGSRKGEFYFIGSVSDRVRASVEHADRGLRLLFHDLNKELRFLLAADEVVEAGIDKLVYVRYNRSFGELAQVNFGMVHVLGEATKKGFRLGRECDEQYQAALEDGNYYETEVDLTEDEPPLVFWQDDVDSEDGGEDEDGSLGELEATLNPMGNISRQYRYKWEGASPFSGVRIEATWANDVFTFRLSNQFGQEYQFRIAGYFDLSVLTHKGAVSLSRAREIVKSVFPDARV